MNHKYKKKWGQNFIKDQNIIKKIINVINPKENDKIIEIGPGKGALTDILSNNIEKLTAVEIDPLLCLMLKKKYSNNIKIINNDIINIIKNKNLGQNIIVFGNLPYNISTQILAEFVLLRRWPPWYKILIFMFQKEVADRIIAKNNSKSFSRLSVLCNWRLEVKKHFNISKNCFYPKPKVNSTILSFQAKEKDVFPIKNPKNLEMITRIFFSNRRKMINKNFVKLFKNNKSIANELNLDLNLRPEQLSCEMYYKITAKYEKLFG